MASSSLPDLNRSRAGINGAPYVSYRLVQLQVVSRLRGATQRAVRLLVLVLDFNLGKFQRAALGGNDTRGRPRRREGAHEQVAGRDLEVLLLFLARLARDEHRVLDVRAVA